MGQEFVGGLFFSRSTFVFLLSYDTTMHDFLFLATNSPRPLVPSFVYGPVRSLRRGLVELQRPVERLERVAQLGLSRLVQARVHPARLSPLAGLEAQEVADNLVSKVSAANPAAISDWA